MRLYLRKNDLSKNPKRPYFTLVVPPDKEGGDSEWKEVAVFWKAKSGNGYNGMVSKGALIDVSQVHSWKDKQSEQAFKDIEIGEEGQTEEEELPPPSAD